MNSDEIRVIGALEAQFRFLVERIDRAEILHEQRHLLIFKRLEKLEASSQFNKGRMSWIGAVSMAVFTVSGAAIATIIAKFIKVEL